MPQEPRGLCSIYAIKILFGCNEFTWSVEVGVPRGRDKALNTRARSPSAFRVSGYIRCSYSVVRMNKISWYSVSASLYTSRNRVSSEETCTYMVEWHAVAPSENGCLQLCRHPAFAGSYTRKAHKRQVIEMLHMFAHSSLWATPRWSGSHDLCAHMCTNSKWPVSIWCFH